MNQNIQLSVSPEQLEQIVSAYIATAKMEYGIALYIAGGLLALGLLVLFLCRVYKETELTPLWVGPIILSVLIFGISTVISVPAYTPQAHDWAVTQIITAKHR